MIEFVAVLGLFVLMLAVIGAVADWWESPERRDSRERSRAPRYWRDR